MIAILGATGTNGRQVVQALRKANAPVRAIVRDPAKADDLKKLGAGLAVGDLAKPDTLRAAFNGARSLFLLGPVAPNQADLELDAIAAAKAAGVGHVVKLSAIGADPLSSGHFSRSHGLVESALKSSGLGWTIVRGAFFYSNLMFSAAAIKQGAYVGFWGDNPAAWVDPADLSAVCAACLLDARTAGETLITTGPAAVTNAELVKTLGDVLGRPIQYINQSESEYATTLITHGSPDWYAKAEVALGQVVFSGVAREVTDVVRRLTGHAPKPIAQYIEENRAALS